MDEPHEPVPPHQGRLEHLVARVLVGLDLVVTLGLLVGSIVVLVIVARTDGMASEEWLLAAVFLLVDGALLFRWLPRRRDSESTPHRDGNRAGDEQ
jgi:hypothetical protein